MEPLARLACERCRTRNATGGTSCRACGAPLGVKNLLSGVAIQSARRRSEDPHDPVTDLSLGPGVIDW